MLWMMLQVVHACDARTDTAELQSAMERAEAAYGSLDLEGFATATNDFRRVLECLEDPVTRPVAAQVHRLQGLRAFVDQEAEYAKLAFAAARAIQGSYRFPETLIPTGNPVLVVYDAVPLTMGTSQTVSSPGLEAYWGFDGRTTDQRPVNWPTLVQRFDGSGAVADTAYLWPGDPLPLPAGAPPPIPSPLPAPDPASAPAPAERGGAGSVVLLGGAVGTGVVAGAIYYSAYRASQNFEAPGLSEAQVQGYYDKARSRTVVSAGVGALAAGLGVGAVLTW